MTISEQQRLESMAKALAYMLARIEDQNLSVFYVDVKEEPLTTLPATTWIELTELGFVKDRGMANARQYHFTPSGWLAALKLTGRLNDDQELKDRCSTLAATLKGYVKGRHHPHDVEISHHRLSADTKLPFGWLLNAIKSDLLQEMFPDKKMNAYWDANRTTFKVPPTFGMELLG